jgi:hypothetical protein
MTEDERSMRLGELTGRAVNAMGKEGEELAALVLHVINQGAQMAQRLINLESAWKLGQQQIVEMEDVVEAAEALVDEESEADALSAEYEERGPNDESREELWERYDETCRNALLAEDALIAAVDRHQGFGPVWLESCNGFEEAHPTHTDLMISPEGVASLDAPMPIEMDTYSPPEDPPYTSPEEHEIDALRSQVETLTRDLADVDGKSAVYWREAARIADGELEIEKARAAAAEERAARLEQLLVKHWHDSSYAGSLRSWLELSHEEYAAFVEGRESGEPTDD